uniref:Death domain-containing protein n=1 Tax=Amphimedon queenslandica TaxID=400682 RepID=A0A1X7UB89_AMPQE
MSLEDKCWTAFVKGDHEEAARLLPLVKEPNKIKRKYDMWIDTSLVHLSSRHGWLDVTKDLITKYHCDPQERGGLDWTCLHWAARGNQVDVMRYLIDECHCDPMTVDWKGRIPLHWAARWDYSAVAEYLLLTGKCDPLAKDYKGRTPFKLAKEEGNTDTLSVLKKFGGIKSSHPIDSYVNVLLVGNPGAGKGTLSHVINDTASFTFLGSFRNVGGVVPCTAGIIPYKLQHRTLGNIILHDFAGHSEYYSSHSAVIENLLQGSGGVFLIVVNILEKKAVKQLHQWLTVVRNEAHKALNQCHVIVIVSHVDEMSNPVEKTKRKEEIQEIIEKGRYDRVFLDCPYPVNTPRERTVYSVKDILSAIDKREDFLVKSDGTKGEKVKEILPDESLSDISNLSLLGGRDIKEVIEITEEFKTPLTPIKLGIKDLVTIIEELTILNQLDCTKWYQFGLHLGLYDPRLKAIETDYRGKTVECFRECMSAWLREDKVREKGGPSWSSLATALDTIEEKSIASYIRNKYYAAKLL